jgi:hypothetical protein
LGKAETTWREEGTALAGKAWWQAAKMLVGSNCVRANLRIAVSGKRSALL